MSVDQAAALALDGRPSLVLGSVNFPSGGAGVWRVQLRPANGAPVTVNVDAKSATATVVPAPPSGSGEAKRRLIHQLHGGEQTPMIWRIWITLAGVAPLILGLSGIIVWIRRKGRVAA